MSCFFDPGHLVSQTEHCGATQQSFLNPIKPRLSQENRDELNSLTGCIAYEPVAFWTNSSYCKLIITDSSVKLSIQRGVPWLQGVFSVRYALRQKKQLSM